MYKFLAFEAFLRDTRILVVDSHSTKLILLL